MTDLNKDIFDILVKYHFEVNLAKCAPYIKNGVILAPANHNKPVEEGLENKEYDGIIILKNGTTLLKNLVKDGYVNKKAIDEFKDVSTIDKFMYFLNGLKGEDGAYVLESSNKQIARVSKIYNPERPIEKRVPLDFVYFNGMNGASDPWKELYLKIGTKTRLAIELTQIYPDINAFGIKRSVYPEKPGMGKVVHVNNKGLKRESFLMHFPEYKEEKYLDPEHEIVGVYREYKHENGNLIRVKQKIMDPLDHIKSELLLV